MSAAKQLDLFSQSADPEGPHSPGVSSRPVIACETLSDEGLISALRNAGIRDSIGLAAETGHRRLAAAIPALEALCRRFAGFGADRIVPEQAAALDALAAIGGGEAAQALVRVIIKGVVQGPCLQKAVSAAAGLRARMPAGSVLKLLQHDDPQIRADACRCVRASPEAAALLHDLSDDLHPYVQMAAACALGRLGRREVRPLLLRFLREKPSTELIDATAPIADEECVILLGRVADARPDLSQAVLDALDGIDHPRAEGIAADIRESCLPHPICHNNGTP
jgi:HEAT repeat protein